MSDPYGQSGRSISTSSIPRRRTASSAARSSSLTRSPSNHFGEYPTRSSLIERVASNSYGISIDEGSPGSAPRIASSTSAQSSTVRQIAPILSNDQHSAMAPVRATRPNVGRSPVAPQRIQGETMEPSVSVPRLNPNRPAAVPAADPALDPLEPFSRFQGLLVRPSNQRSPYANAPSVVLATSTAPASSSRFTTAASSSGTRSLYGVAPQVVLIPAVSRRSFAPHGIPCSGPRYRPAAISLSAFVACRSARTAVSVTTDSSFGPIVLSRVR